jgi:hypothetical protein
MILHVVYGMLTGINFIDILTPGPAPGTLDLRYHPTRCLGVGTAKALFVSPCFPITTQHLVSNPSDHTKEGVYTGVGCSRLPGQLTTALLCERNDTRSDTLRYSLMLRPHAAIQIQWPRHAAFTRRGPAASLQSAWQSSS